MKHTPRRCVDFIYYYPNQKIPGSGACGIYACGGSLETTELEADSDFNRIFGLVDTCTMDVADDVVEVGSPFEYYYNHPATEEEAVLLQSG